MRLDQVVNAYNSAGKSLEFPMCGADEIETGADGHRRERVRAEGYTVPIKVSLPGSIANSVVGNTIMAVDSRAFGIANPQAMDIMNDHAERAISYWYQDPDVARHVACDSRLVLQYDKEATPGSATAVVPGTRNKPIFQYFGTDTGGSRGSGSPQGPPPPGGAGDHSAEGGGAEKPGGPDTGPAAAAPPAPKAGTKKVSNKFSHLPRTSVFDEDTSPERKQAEDKPDDDTMVDDEELVKVWKDTPFGRIRELPQAVINSWKEKAIGMSLPTDELPNIEYEDDRITGASRPYDMNWLAPEYTKERCSGKGGGDNRPYYCSWFKVPRDMSAGGKTAEVGWNRLRIVELHDPEDMCVNLGPSRLEEKSDRANDEFMKWIVRSLVYLSAAQPLIPKDEYRINMKGHVGEKRKRSDCIIVATMDTGGWLSLMNSCRNCRSRRI
jgi:hypothetical protein